QSRLRELAAVVPLHAAGLVELGARVSTRVDVLGEAGLVVLGEKLVSSALLAIDADEVLVVALSALCDLGHVPSSFVVVRRFSEGLRAARRIFASKPTYNSLGFERVPPIVYRFGADSPTGRPNTAVRRGRARDPRARGRLPSVPLAGARSDRPPGRPFHPRRRPQRPATRPARLPPTAGGGG